MLCNHACCDHFDMPFLAGGRGNAAVGAKRRRGQGADVGGTPAKRGSSCAGYPVDVSDKHSAVCSPPTPPFTVQVGVAMQQLVRSDGVRRAPMPAVRQLSVAVTRVTRSRCLGNKSTVCSLHTPPAPNNAGGRGNAAVGAKRRRGQGADGGKAAKRGSYAGYSEEVFDDSPNEYEEDDWIVKEDKKPRQQQQQRQLQPQPSQQQSAAQVGGDGVWCWPRERLVRGIISCQSGCWCGGVRGAHAPGGGDLFVVGVWRQPTLVLG